MTTIALPVLCTGELKMVKILTVRFHETLIEFAILLIFSLFYYILTNVFEIMTQTAEIMNTLILIVKD